jgi:low temperature requirement protein LtrA
MALLISGSMLEGTARILMWTLAVTIDYAGPALLTCDRLRNLQTVAVAHFANQYGLFVIICLGESIVAIGVTAASQSIDANVMTSLAVGLIAIIALWWIYFDRTARDARERLVDPQDAVLLLPTVTAIFIWSSWRGSSSSLWG